MTPLRTAARTLLSAIFVTSGAKAVTDPEQLAGAAKPFVDRFAPTLDRTSALLPAAVTRRGIHAPTDTRMLVQIAGGVQVMGGLLMLTRLARPAAAVLAASLIPTTLAGHPFWTYSDPVERREQRIHFTKNLGLLGGLILAAVDTQGRPGLRWRANRMVRDARRHAARVARTARRDVRIAVRSANIGRRVPGR